MSDRFRFRAWLKDRKKYDYDIEDCFEDWVFENFGQYLKDKDVIVEQCTGLKDKNGKLIYEGDIVRINGWWNACGPAGYNENKTVVKWNEEVAGFEPMCIYDCDCQVYHEAEKCEVIGNIHENADLLGE